MRRLLIVALVLAAGGFAGLSFDRLSKANIVGGGGAPPFSGSCSESTAWFARSGSLNLTHENAGDTMICGLVTDGVWALLDALWVPATQNTTAALLNMVSSSFPLTIVGSPTFTADGGYAGTENDPATNYLDTGFTPPSSGTHYTQDAAHLSVWSFTDHQATSSAFGVAFGASDSGGNTAYILPWYNDGNSYGAVNEGTGSQVSVVVSHSIGSWLITRANSGVSDTFYRNGASIGTGGGSSSTVACSMFIGASNQCVMGAHNGSALQIAAASVGGHLTAAQVSSLGSTPVTSSNAAAATGLIPRICTYLTAVHGSC